MSTNCIHGFSTQQCSSCGTCKHGQVRSSCGRCRAATTTRRTVAGPAVESPPSEDYVGFVIFYEASVSGWRYRGQDAAGSEQSYRSAFLARKAVDALPAGAINASAASPSKRGAKPKS